MIFDFFARAHLRHLEKEIEVWRAMWRAERQRANLAYDRLLSEKGVAGITGPTLPDVIGAPSDEDERHADEFARMGEIPHV